MPGDADKTKVYRLAYCFDGADPPTMQFSGWVMAGNRSDVIADILAVNPPDQQNGASGGIEPTFLGWEEKALEELDD